MRSVDELRGFLAVHKQADDYAQSVNSDLDSDDYKKSYVLHFKHLLSLTDVDFAVNFLIELAEDLKGSDAFGSGTDWCFEFGYISSFVKYLPDELEHALVLKSAIDEIKSSHGGAREGAGRPKKPTKQIRVPEQMVEDIKALCSVYPTHNPDCEDESDMTPKDHLSIEVLRVLDALKCYVESNIDSQSFEPFKY